MNKQAVLAYAEAYFQQVKGDSAGCPKEPGAFSWLCDIDNEVANRDFGNWYNHACGVAMDLLLGEKEKIKTLTLGWLRVNCGESPFETYKVACPVGVNPEQLILGFALLLSNKPRPRQIEKAEIAGLLVLLRAYIQTTYRLKE